MNPNPQRAFPSAGVKIRLLQDAVYLEDGETWTTLLRHRPQIANFFQEIGLELVVHEEDGFAYVRQTQEEELMTIPRLFRREKLTKAVAIIGVVLREQLLQFDASVHDESRLTLRREEIIQLVSPFFPETNDSIRADKRIDSALNKAEEMGLLRLLPGAEGDERYEVRRIIKARFPAETLKVLRDQLQTHANARDTQ